MGWTKNPIPACGNLAGGGLHTSSIGHKQHGTITPGLSACSTEELDFWRARFNFNIIDKVQIPASLAPGEYLLSFRWDTEQTPQIWTNCADVTVTPSSALTLV